MPYARAWHPSAREAARDFVYFGLNGAMDGLVKLGVAFAVAAVGAWDNALPFAVAVPLAVLVADFGGYWLHRWGHHGWLWKVHGVHHTPDKVNTWNTVLLSTGEQRLTSFTQDGGVRAGDLREDLEDPLHRRRLPDDAFEAVSFVEAPLQFHVAAGERLLLHLLGHHLADRVDVEGLLEVRRGPLLHRLDGGLHAPLAGDDDHDDVRDRETGLPQKVDPGHLPHDEIGEDQVHVLGTPPGPLQRAESPRHEHGHQLHSGRAAAAVPLPRRILHIEYFHL